MRVGIQLALLSSCVMSALVPAVATAGTASVDGVTVRFAGADGEPNRLTAAVERVQGYRLVVLADAGAPIAVGNECTALGPNRVRCGTPEAFRAPRAIRIAAGDADDVVELEGDVADAFAGDLHVDAGSGNDRIDALPGTPSGLSRVGDLGWETPRRLRLLGGPGDDVLQGGADDELLDGGGGRDEVRGARGFDVLRDGDVAGESSAHGDTLDGGSGRDRLDAGSSPASVVVDLAAGIAESAGQRDALASLENVTASAHDDRIAGDTRANLILAGAGVDRVNGRAGDDEIGDLEPGTIAPSPDRLTGGPGSDWISYLEAERPVRVRLAERRGGIVGAAPDRLVGFENVEGGAGDDTLVGDAGANALLGRRGVDRLSGGAGADRLWPDSRDSAAGGPGNDVFEGFDAFLELRSLSCGSGTDVVRRPSGLFVPAGCERIDSETFHFGQRGSRAAGFLLGARPSVRGRFLLLEARCPAGRRSCRGDIDVHASGRPPAGRSNVALAEDRFRIRAGGRGRLAVRLTPPGREFFRTVRHPRIVVSVDLRAPESSYSWEVRL